MLPTLNTVSKKEPVSFIKKAPVSFGKLPDERKEQIRNAIRDDELMTPTEVAERFGVLPNGLYKVVQSVRASQGLAPPVKTPSRKGKRNKPAADPVQAETRSETRNESPAVIQLKNQLLVEQLQQSHGEIRRLKAKLNSALQLLQEK